MKCREFARFLGPYLDSELDAKTSLEMSQHAESCAACATRLDGERLLESAVARRLAAGAPTREIWENALRSLEEPRRSRRRLPWIGGGALAGLLAVLAILVALGRGHREMDLASAAYEHHRDYLLGHSPPEVDASHPSAIQSFLDREMPFSVSVDGAVDVELRGARRCFLESKLVAFLVGRFEDEETSLMVFPASDIASFPDAAARLAKEGPVIHCVVNGFHFAAAASPRLVACGVTRSSRAALERSVAGLAGVPSGPAR
jgi:hypothetical protein